MRYSPRLNVCVSADEQGGLELWCTDTCKRATKENRRGSIQFSLKSETDLFELAKVRQRFLVLCFKPFFLSCLHA